MHTGYLIFWKWFYYLHNHKINCPDPAPGYFSAMMENEERRKTEIADTEFSEVFIDIYCTKISSEKNKMHRRYALRCVLPFNIK